MRRTISNRRTVVLSLAALVTLSLGGCNGLRFAPGEKIGRAHV